MLLRGCCVLQETGRVGGGQQPDRGNLPDPAAAANHLLPPAPSFTDQRLCQPGRATCNEEQNLIYSHRLLIVCLYCQVMGVVGPSSVADGLPLLHLSPYLSPPLPFSTAVVRLVALQIQVGVSI